MNLLLSWAPEGAGGDWITANLQESYLTSAEESAKLERLRRNASTGEQLVYRGMVAHAMVLDRGQATYMHAWE